MIIYEKITYDYKQLKVALSRDNIEVNGLKFHVQRIGQGTPLVMIMGLGAPGEKWKHNYELLLYTKNIL